MIPAIGRESGDTKSPDKEGTVQNFAQRQQHLVLLLCFRICHAQ
ncbi:MAG: hypothetical protein WAT46_19155 [Saprospiraceae bacterium]